MSLSETILTSIASTAKRIVFWLIACLIAIFIGVTSQTQFVLNRLISLGADISFSDRVSTSLYDLQHLGSTYGFFIAIALTLAFLAAGSIYRFVKFSRLFIYAVAGGTAIIILLFSIKAKFFGIHILAGARDIWGLSFQLLAGVIAGLVFAALTAPLLNKRK